MSPANRRRSQGEEYFSWLNRPSLSVNRFRVKNPNAQNERYLYVPGDSEKVVLGHMEGLSVFIVFGAGLGAGLSIMLSFTPEILSYGMTLSLTAGVEFDVATGATYTWFHKAPPRMSGR